MRPKLLVVPLDAEAAAASITVTLQPVRGLKAGNVVCEG